MSLEKGLAPKLRIKNVYVRQFLAEFLGTFILIAFGIGVNASAVLGKGTTGGYQSVTWGWCIAVAFAVWTSGAVSGGHVNPAVTLAMAVLGRFQFRRVPIYWLGQYLGAFVGSACVYGIYHEALNNYDGGIRSVTGENATAGIWNTFPQPYLTIASGFGDQVFGTMLLVLCVMAVTDDKNTLPPNGLIPLVIGLIVYVIGVSFGLNCGYPINPARDFAPRVFTAMAGWGEEVFTAYNYWFWVPLVAPHIGGIIGGFIYLLLIGFHLETAEEVVKNQEKRKNLHEINDKMSCANEV